MKYVYFGSPRISAIVLKKLIDGGMPPAALVANPDRPAGRKKIITPPATKELVREAHPSIPILQPETLDDAFVQEISALDPDFFVVAMYNKIIPDRILKIAKRGTLGVHPSLLPKHRGPSPMQTAILEGDAETGVTIYLMDAKMDHGPILAEAKCPLDSLTTQNPELEDRLCALAGDLLLETIPKFIADAIPPRIQDESQATFTKKFVTEDAFIDPDDLARAERGDLALAKTIVRKMNAFTPEPGAWTRKDGTRVKLLAGEIKNGALSLTLIQNEGEKPKKPIA